MIASYYAETEQSSFCLYEGELSEEEFEEWNRELCNVIEKCRKKSKKQIRE